MHLICIIRILVLQKVLQKLSYSNEEYTYIFSSVVPTVKPKLEKELKFLYDQQSLQRKYDQTVLFDLIQTKPEANCLDELKYVCTDISEQETASSSSVTVVKSEGGQQINDNMAELRLYKQRVAILETAVVYLRHQNEATNLKLMETQKQLVDSLEPKQSLTLPCNYYNQPTDQSTVLPFIVTETSDPENLQMSLAEINTSNNNNNTVFLVAKESDINLTTSVGVNAETMVLRKFSVFDDLLSNQPNDILKVSDVQDVKTETAQTSHLRHSKSTDMSVPMISSSPQQTATICSQQVIISPSNPSQPSRKATVAVTMGQNIINGMKLAISHIFNSINNILTQGISFLYSSCSNIILTAY